MFKKPGKNKVIIVLLACFLGVLILAYPLYWLGCAAVNVMRGNPHCVIAEQYDRITLYGKTYLPLDTGVVSYNTNELLIREARVENEHYLTKILFHDLIFSVKGCTTDDLIYLQTDYDSAPSVLYCLEEKLPEYQKQIADFKATHYYYEAAETGLFRFQTTNVPLDVSLAERMVQRDLPLHNTHLPLLYGEDTTIIHLKGYDENGVFFDSFGGFIQHKGQYYWNDDADTTYVLPDEYDALLDGYFAYAS